MMGCGRLRLVAEGMNERFRSLWPEAVIPAYPALASARRQPEGPGARGPGQLEVGRVRVTVLIEADLVELGEVAVVARHDGVVLGNAGLVGEDLNVGRSPLAFEPDVHRLTGAEVAAP